MTDTDDLPADIAALLEEVDAFIEREIAPLEAEHPQFFDHRREMARTDLERGGLPARAWEDLLREAQRRADEAGLLRYALPGELGGRDGTNLGMAVVREHMARRGIGLHNDPQSEISIIGNFPTVLLLHEFGSEEQKRALLAPALRGEVHLAFGLTEPNHGSDATYLETTARREDGEWVLDGTKRFNTGMHAASHDLVFARTSGETGSPAGITAFIVPTGAPGVTVESYWWTFNMPTDHAEVRLEGVRLDDGAILGDEGAGLVLAQRFVHENRIRQAASSLGSAEHCIDVAVRWARERVTWGRPLWRNQAIQFPLAELWTECEMVRGLVRRTAAGLDRRHHMEVSHLVAMANYRANRLVCEAADRAMQTCGGMGYTRHMPFEHIYRHHRRYRITEGSEEIQLRKVGYALFSGVG